MNIRGLDRNKTYDLSELNDEQLQSILDWLKENDIGWNDQGLDAFKYGLDKEFLYYLVERGWDWKRGIQEPVNAIELFYTLENVQVFLYEDELDKMKIAVKNKGFNISNTSGTGTMFRTNYVGDFIVGVKLEDYYTVTFTEFMELLDEKPNQVREEEEVNDLGQNKEEAEEFDNNMDKLIEQTKCILKDNYYFYKGDFYQVIGFSESKDRNNGEWYDSVTYKRASSEPGTENNYTRCLKDFKSKFQKVTIDE